MVGSPNKKMVWTAKGLQVSNQGDGQVAKLFTLQSNSRTGGSPSLQLPVQRLNSSL
jgi:hypothetical protein